VAADQVDVLPGGAGDAEAERAAAHLGERRALVVDVHRLQAGRELAQLLDVAERQLREEADADPSIVAKQRDDVGFNQPRVVWAPASTVLPGPLNPWAVQDSAPEARARRMRSWFRAQRLWVLALPGGSLGRRL
jgi:hypothetical protein